MKVKELIERLKAENPEADVMVEQTNNCGPESVSEVQRYINLVVIVGDPFK